MKYDCSKTLDFLKERIRMCKAHVECEKCPFIDIDCDYFNDITQEVIDGLQKWSDEHPETPKLTREERDFLDCFYDNQGMAIQRVLKDRLYVRQHSPVYIDSIMIDPNLFPFIKDGEEWSFDDLLSLGVE